MILQIEKALTDNIYKVTLTPTNWSQQDLNLMDKYGEPEVETGGTGTLNPQFEFPTQLRKVKSGFPFTRAIDGDGDSDAEAKMNNWATEMQTRISTVLTTLRGNTDNFSGTIAITV